MNVRSSSRVGNSPVGRVESAAGARGRDGVAERGLSRDVRAGLEVGGFDEGGRGNGHFQGRPGSSQTHAGFRCSDDSDSR